MFVNRIKELLKRDEVVLGTWVTFQESLSAQILGRIGFDFLSIDMEHGPVTLDALQRIALATATTPALPIVRTAWNDSRAIQVPLDCGIAGVIVPYVNDLATAHRVMQDARYPPLGGRSCGGLRSPFAFGVDIPTYFAGANEQILLFLMTETKAAVGIAADVAALEGVDGLFVGPHDLSISLGLRYPEAWDEGVPALHDAVASVAKVALRAGKFAGILAKDAAMAKRCIALGYRFIAVGGDARFLESAARQTHSELRQ
ncbi:MAG TPA: aldolase/citrate lyase family protein [Candidatus Baltobacteraceae bacterium]|jgi:2-keto-3-deoxy-L-rhamnonate aldolase RhmA|nr:aldolase/citrate lyase family protein [Candidatus Baltobacteraceae bacterium]